MIKRILLQAFAIVAICALPGKLTAQNGKLILKFVHLANEKKIIRNDSVYSTPNGEPYTISKLRYYVSEIGSGKPSRNIFLVDAFGPDSIEMKLPAGHYQQLSFLLGVDSLLNCSGAQDGALDPLKDMFWTWNSGYVMFKLEGKSDSSHADLNRIEQHIGGYKGENKTMRRITLNLPEKLVIDQKKTHTVVIEVDLDKYWNKASISANPVIVIPGTLAKRAADNFPLMFRVKSIL
ncbi:MbnP family protein [Ferruginibacter sp. HRS2-29]|uniref:MbnP family protein n=1 Tax=Ferruginibacter sp. HRS2-29 TaxID=2487334 RepID=UPI0020CC5F3C|nr:MbnP family protein [Ferruginibacter sp. HRS2-29]MCP9752696.1 hypothetical protein [Ferruginibacter sp. HRS2-29]